MAELSRASLAATAERRIADLASSPPSGFTGEFPVPGMTGEFAIPAAPRRTGRLVRVMIDPASPMRGARATLVLRKAQALGTVSAVFPAAAALVRDSFDGRFAFRLQTELAEDEVIRVLRSAGDVLAVEFGEVANTGQRAGDRSRWIRVDLARLDAVLAATAELVVERNRLAAVADARGDAQLGELADRIGRLVSRLQGDVMAARLTPVRAVFERFPRAVRDLARQLGKDVVLELEGEDIELDRSIVDDIADPLLHLLRNAVDHGIEPAEVRRAAGKPPQGRIVVSASRDRNTVAIAVSDDGAGINRARVLERAKARGLVPADTAVLGDDQLLEVLARPGFTTAGHVSEVSGRGVGIDVVLTRARSLGASVQLKSEEGQGTTFTLRVPLTLAILRAFLVSAAGETFAVPLAFVREVVDQMRLRLDDDGHTLTVRDEPLPAVHLTPLVADGRPAHVRGRTPEPGGAVVLEAGEARTALLVDQLLGQEELVVEPFVAPRGMPRFIGGATVLADGQPALILDATALLQGSRP